MSRGVECVSESFWSLPLGKRFGGEFGSHRFGVLVSFGLNLWGLFSAVRLG